MLRKHNNQLAQRFVQQLNQALDDSQQETTELTKELRKATYSTDSKQRQSTLQAIDTQINTFESNIRPLRQVVENVPSTGRILESGFSAVDAIDNVLDQLEKDLKSKYGVTTTINQNKKQGIQRNRPSKLSIDRLKNSIRNQFEHDGANDGDLNTKLRGVDILNDDDVDDEDDQNIGNKSEMNHENNRLKTNCNDRTNKSYSNVNNAHDGGNKSSFAITPKRDDSNTSKTTQKQKDIPKPMPKTPRLEDFDININELNAALNINVDDPVVSQQQQKGLNATNPNHQVDTSEWNNGEDFPQNVEKSMRKMGVDMSQYAINQQYDAHRHKALTNILAYSTPSGVTGSNYNANLKGDQDYDGNGNDDVRDDTRDYSHLAAGYSTYMNADNSYHHVGRHLDPNPKPNRELKFDEEDDD